MTALTSVHARDGNTPGNGAARVHLVLDAGDTTLCGIPAGDAAPPTALCTRCLAAWSTSTAEGQAAARHAARGAIVAHIRDVVGRDITWADLERAAAATSRGAGQ